MPFKFPPSYYFHMLNSVKNIVSCSSPCTPSLSVLTADSGAMHHSSTSLPWLVSRLFSLRTLVELPPVPVRIGLLSICAGGLIGFANMLLVFLHQLPYYCRTTASFVTIYDAKPSFVMSAVARDVNAKKWCPSSLSKAVYHCRVCFFCECAPSDLPESGKE